MLHSKCWEPLLRLYLLLDAGKEVHCRSPNRQQRCQRDWAAERLAGGVLCCAPLFSGAWSPVRHSANQFAVHSLACCSYTATKFSVCRPPCGATTALDMVWRRLPSFLPNISLKPLPLSEAQQKAFQATGFLKEIAFKTAPSTSKVGARESRGRGGGHVDA